MFDIKFLLGLCVGMAISFIIVVTVEEQNRKLEKIELKKSRWLGYKKGQEDALNGIIQFDSYKSRDGKIHTTIRDSTPTWETVK